MLSELFFCYNNYTEFEIKLIIIHPALHFCEEADFTRC